MFIPGARPLGPRAPRGGTPVAVKERRGTRPFMDSPINYTHFLSNSTSECDHSRWHNPPMRRFVQNLAATSGGGSSQVAATRERAPLRRRPPAIKGMGYSGSSPWNRARLGRRLSPYLLQEPCHEQPIERDDRRAGMARE